MKPGAEGEHRLFVDQLRSPEAAKLLQKCSLTEYAVYQRGNELEIIFKSEKPTIIPGLLSNKRLWPLYWEFHQPGESDVPTDKPRVFRWSLREASGQARE